MEVQTKREQWNKRFRTVQLNRKIRIKPLKETSLGVTHALFHP